MCSVSERMHNEFFSEVIMDENIIQTVYETLGSRTDEIIGMANGKAYDLVNGKVIDGCREFMFTKRLNGNIKEKISDDFLTFIHTMFPDKNVCDY